MTFEQFIELAKICVPAGAAVLAAWLSARSGNKKVLDKLSSYVTVAEYREKTAGLHAEINELRTRIAVLEDRERR